MRFTVKSGLGWGAALCLLLATGCAPTAADRADEQREPHFLQGKGRLQALDYAGAIESFERALEVNPRSASAHFELGLLYEEKVKDHAVAIYHYQRFLRLRPEAPHADNFRQRIMVCKQLLASDVSLGPLTQQSQKEIELLAAENTRLKQRTAELEDILARRATNAPALFAAAPAPRNETPPPALNNSVTPRAEPKAAPRTTPAAARTYTVKSGDTLTTIARRHSVTVAALEAANPGVNERRLPVGKTLTIPAR
jgi:LysM repeat protein